MTVAKLTLFIILLFIGIQSCKSFHSKELIPLPVVNNNTSLNSSQADIVYQYARYFPNGTQISIAFLTGDNDKYIGIKRINDSLVYTDNSNNVFEIGSITKSFTGIMLAKLIYEGKISPDEPIKYILPIRLKQSSLNGVEITLSHLALHTSGLPFEPEDVKNDNANYDRYDPYNNYSYEKLYNYLTNKMKLYSIPGEKRTYSNLGFGLLGHILTLINDKSYEQVLSETICKPLDMQNTFLTFNDEHKHLLVPGRNENGNLLQPGKTHLSSLAGCGGIKSTARDLIKYLKANINDTTYFYEAQKTIKVYDKNFTGNYAWATYNGSGKHIVGAFGATGGYTSGIIFERSKHTGIVVLTNVSPFLPSGDKNTEQLCKTLYNQLTISFDKK